MRSLRSALGAAGRRVPRRPFRIVLPYALGRPLARFWFGTVRDDRDATRAMRRLLVIHDDLYGELDRAAIAYGDGVHVKHRVTRYHDFFVERVRPGERVLDVGCGKGELALDLAERASAEVVGIDNDPAHLAFARARSAHPRVSYVEGTLPEALPDGHFDVLVLSNVLEHFDDRVALLGGLVASASPRLVLVRVPVHARHWSVPVREELGLDHFSDPGHWVEYDPNRLREELGRAGLDVVEEIVIWGEIWAAAAPRDGAAHDGAGTSSAHKAASPSANAS
jgi:SAM-dependent methyltransferase